MPCEPLVLVEGVGAGRAALRPLLSRLLWMDLDRESSWARGRRRDGPALSPFWDRWVRAESMHFAADPSRKHAGLLVRELPGGSGRSRAGRPRLTGSARPVTVTYGDPPQSMRCEPDAGSGCCPNPA